MSDFSSALYLGMRHPWAEAGGWSGAAGWPALTLGKPAALEEAPCAQTLAARLARLQGCAAAVLLPSTLHLFWDLFGMLAQEPLAVLIDAGAYPIARWCAQRMALAGWPQRVFRHGCAAALAALVRQLRQSGRRPLILADGYSPGQAAPPPLAAYAAIAADAGGYLVLDDTQVLGVCGVDGGGSLRPEGRPALAGRQILVGASLAKGFGVPLAVLGGSAALLRRFDAASQTRRHCSPPALATVAAAHQALRINRHSGGRLRGLLWERVRQWRQGLARLGIAGGGGRFPVQTVALTPGTDAPALQAALARAGVNALAQQVGGAASLVFLLRADHRPEEIDCALGALAQLLRRQYVSIV
ncbi:pyridoxal phosphate-dependent aminotransferase family protein [Oxalobacteraceae bacterium]|nr:pyridoxal phosphate-dependent aminotransferase family protein [Oxalobacteraceae bacterium]